MTWLALVVVTWALLLVPLGVLCARVLKPRRTTGSLRLVCAWCERTIRAGAGPVSHGICEECREGVRPWNVDRGGTDTNGAGGAAGSEHRGRRAASCSESRPGERG